MVKQGKTYYQKAKYNAGKHEWSRMEKWMLISTILAGILLLIKLVVV